MSDQPIPIKELEEKYQSALRERDRILKKTPKARLKPESSTSNLRVRTAKTPFQPNPPKFSGDVKDVKEYTEAVQSHSNSLKTRHDDPLRTHTDGETVCCPKCLRPDTRNTTSRLNRKQRRSSPKIDGFQVEEEAFCVYCNSRMVRMPTQERLRRLVSKENQRIEVIR